MLCVTDSQFNSEQDIYCQFARILQNCQFGQKITAMTTTAHTVKCNSTKHTENGPLEPQNVCY